MRVGTNNYWRSLLLLLPPVYSCKDFSSFFSLLFLFSLCLISQRQKNVIMLCCQILMFGAKTDLRTSCCPELLLGRMGRLGCPGRDFPTRGAAAVASLRKGRVRQISCNLSHSLSLFKAGPRAIAGSTAFCISFVGIVACSSTSR